MQGELAAIATFAIELMHDPNHCKETLRDLEAKAQSIEHVLECAARKTEVWFDVPPNEWWDLN